MRRRVVILGVFTVMAGWTPAVQANCNPAKLLSTWGDGGYRYVNLPVGADNDTIVGRFWQKGNRGLANEGSYDDASWLKLYAGTGRWYLEGNLGDARVLGCPAGNLIVMLDHADGASLTLESIETPASAKHYDFSTLNTDFTFAAKPRPQLTVLSHSGTTFHLSVVTQEQAGGNYGPQSGSATVSPGYRLATGAGPNDPGAGASLYVPGPAMTPGVPLMFSVDCGDNIDKWLAIQLVIDGLPSETVGPRSRILCDWILAEPKFKRVERPGRRARPDPR